MNLQIGALNFLHGKQGPWHFGIPLSSQQQAVVDNLVVRARSLSRLGRTDFLRCGSKVAAASDELAALHVLVEGSDDLPYGASVAPSTVRKDSGTASVVPTVADKIAFPSSLQGFDPLPYLSDMSKLAYHNPSSLLGWREEGSAKLMPPDQVDAATRAELHCLGQRWDSVGRLCLASFAEIDLRDRCNLFCIAKPDGELRQIIDRRPRNSRELGPPSDGVKMGHPSSFLPIIIPKDCNLLGSVDDLRNYYHEFEVSFNRAVSTPVGPQWNASDWEGSHALEELRSRHPPASIRSDTKVFMCFQGLSMGDHWAPLIAQEAHENLLKSFDALRPDEHLKFGEILPRGNLGHFSGVCIDDKVNLQLVRKSCPNEPLRDSEACKNGDNAYQAAGLSYHPKKRLRRASVYSAWGAEIEGVEGLVGAKRSRLASLAFATGLAAKSPALTRHLLQVLLGCCAFCFQFRRPLFSIIHELYHVGAPNGSESTPFIPPRKVREELQLLAILGGTALSQLRSPVSDTAYGTDAAPGGAGAVACRIGQTVATELFRRAEGRGFHTKLLSPVTSYLHEKGVDVEEFQPSNDLNPPQHCKSLFAEPPVAEFFEEGPAVTLGLLDEQMCGTVRSDSTSVLASVAQVKKATASPVVGEDEPPRQAEFAGSEHIQQNPPKLIPLRFDFLEVYAGCARMSKAFADKGLVVAPPIDLKQGWNLGKPSLFLLLLGLSLAGRIAIVWLSPPATTFSMARPQKLRSKDQPLGFDLLNIEVLLGNFHIHLALALWLAQWFCGRFAVLATPWTAFTQHLPWWIYCQKLGGVISRLDQCQFGTPY